MTFILIGMAGCGKSCLGKAVSAKLKIKNIDVDKVIEKNTNKKLHEIIDKCGVEEFKKIEEATLLTMRDENAIISTGGSAIYYEKAMQYLKSIGKIIYLYVSLENISARIGDFSKRGIVMRPDQTIQDVYRERTELYEKYADITLNCDGNDYEKYEDMLVEEIKKFI